MKKRVAANKVLVDSDTVENNLMIERNDKGKIIRLACITDLQVEPSSTIFYNGLITSAIDTSNVMVGQLVPQLITDSISIGYQGDLLLWQNLSLSEFRITSNTKITKI